MIDEFSLLGVIRLKGRVTLDALALALDSDEPSVATSVDQAVNGGLVELAGKRFKLAPAGRDRLTTLVAGARQSLDMAAIEELYEEFDEYNTGVKAIIVAWQMKETDIPNDHSDSAYDAAVIADLVDLHHQFVHWLERLATLVPRLSRYITRFDRAISAVQQGDHSFIAKPIADSYHTLWFELHEELLGMLARDRGSEAAAGRAL